MEIYRPTKPWYCKPGEEKEAPSELAKMSNGEFAKDMERFKFTAEELKEHEEEIMVFAELFGANEWKKDHFEGAVLSRKRSPDDGRYVVELIGRLALVGGKKIKPFKEGMATPHRVYLWGKTEDKKHLFPVQIPSPNEAALTEKGKVKPFQMGAMELAMVEGETVKWTAITELAQCKRTAAAEEFQRIFKWNAKWELPFPEGSAEIAFLQLNRSECYSRSPVKRASSKKKRDSSPGRGGKKKARNLGKAEQKVERAEAKKAKAKKAWKKGGKTRELKKELKAAKRKLKVAKKVAKALQWSSSSSSHSSSDEDLEVLSASSS